MKREEVQEARGVRVGDVVNVKEEDRDSWSTHIIDKIVEVTWDHDESLRLNVPRIEHVYCFTNGETASDYDTLRKVTS